MRFHVNNSANGASLSLTDLGILPESIWSAASGINADGQVVGYSTDALGLTHAFVSSGDGVPETLMDLGLLPGDNASSALAINAHGQIVGLSSLQVGFSTKSHLFYYDGAMYDIAQMLSATDRSHWNLLSATGINDLDQISGYGVFRGELHAFRLSPIVPEPGAVTLLMAGLTGMGVPFARRRRLR